MYTFNVGYPQDHTEALMRDRKFIAVISAILAGGIIMLGLFGCGAKKYKVDYDGDREYYEGAKDEYEAGEKVVLYYDLIATDTDYAFYLDDEKINFGYSEDRGFIIEFTMPDHDVKLRCETRNSMEYIPSIDPGTLLVDYYEETVATDGGDGSREITLTYYDPVQVKLDVYKGDDEPVSYLVPYDAFWDCLGIMYSEGLESWNSTDDTVSLDGVRIVVKIRNDYGDYLKVTTDKMPEGGERAFDRIRVALSSYIKYEYRIIGG